MKTHQSIISQVISFGSNRAMKPRTKEFIPTISVSRAGVVALITLLVLWTARPVRAARAEADALPGSGVNAAGATSDLRAYSDDGGVPVTKNAAVAQTNAVGAVVGAASTVTVGAGFIVAGRVYTPGYGIQKLAKPKALIPPVDLEWVKSTTAGSVARAQCSATPYLIALATPVGAGSAAASAEDPGLVGPGSYAYAPMSDNLVVEIDYPGEYAAVEMSADDSSSSTPLYTLVIAAQNALNSPSDLDIKFTYDASRLTLAPGETPASIQNSVRSSFSVAAGVATFGSSSPIFTGTYTVSGGSVMYEDGGIAAAQGVPVVPPPTVPTLPKVWILLLGVLVLGIGALTIGINRACKRA